MNKIPIIYTNQQFGGAVRSTVRKVSNVGASKIQPKARQNLTSNLPKPVEAVPQQEPAPIQAEVLQLPVVPVSLMGSRIINDEWVKCTSGPHAVCEPPYPAEVRITDGSSNTVSLGDEYNKYARAGTVCHPDNFMSYEGDVNASYCEYKRRPGFVINVNEGSEIHKGSSIVKNYDKTLVTTNDVDDDVTLRCKLSNIVNGAGHREVLCDQSNTTVNNKVVTGAITKSVAVVRRLDNNGYEICTKNAVGSSSHGMWCKNLELKNNAWQVSGWVRTIKD